MDKLDVLLIKEKNIPRLLDWLGTRRCPVWVCAEMLLSDGSTRPPVSASPLRCCWVGGHYHPWSRQLWCQCPFQTGALRRRWCRLSLWRVCWASALSDAWAAGRGRWPRPRTAVRLPGSEVNIWWIIIN